MSFNSRQFYLAGIDRTTSIWDKGSFTWTMTNGQRGQATISLMLLPLESLDPQIGDELYIQEIYQDSNTVQGVWAGTIDSRKQNYYGDDGVRVWTLTGVSLEQMFDTQPCPTADFTDADSGAIFSALFAAGSYPIAVILGTIEGGTSLSRSYAPSTTLAAAFSQLATDTGKIWYVDPRDFKVYLTSPTTRTAPWVLTTGDILIESSSALSSIEYDQSRADFRSSQVIQMQPGALPPVNFQAQGDGSTTAFTLPSQASQVIGAAISTSVAATATGTFTATPAPGDTVVISTQTYTLVAALDNTIANQVLISSTPSVMAQRLVDAINTVFAQAGVTFSTPTFNNPYVRAKSPVAGSFVVRANALGTIGNSIPISKTGTHFSWSTAFLTGGVDSPSANLRVGITGAGTYDLYYTPGTATVTLAIAPGAGQLVTLNYVGPQTNLIGGGSSFPSYAMTPRNTVDAAGAAQQAAAVLGAFNILPGVVKFRTYKPGLYLGMSLTIALVTPAPAAALLNGTWLVQDISATWIEGFETLPSTSPDAHFMYEVTVINSVQINPYQATLAQLINTLPGTASGGLTPQVAPVTGPTVFIPVVYSIDLQLSDLTVADDIAPHVVVVTPIITDSPLVHETCEGIKISGVLKKTISADLVVRINKRTNGSPILTYSFTITIPSGTGIDQVVEETILAPFFDGDILSADVLASDGTTDANGIASVNVAWVGGI